MDELREQAPGKGTIAVILAGIALVAFTGLFLLGGQVSAILSNVCRLETLDAVLRPFPYVAVDIE